MKLSISVPDELWAQAAPADASPSEVVQKALSEMVSRRRPRSPWGRAPDPAVLEENKETLDAAVRRLLAERSQMRRDGYRVGAIVAADPAFSLDWFMSGVSHLDLEDWRTYLNDILSEGPDDQFAAPIITVTRNETQVEPTETAGGGFRWPQEFVAGLVDALLDVWDMVESESDVKETP